jgi:glycosyltransferase involved in cell wall biosynthesis
MEDLGLHESKVETIYPFMDICKFVKNSNQAGFRKDMMVPEDTPIILFIGSSEPARIGVFLKALSIVLKKTPLSKVVLVSSYSQHFLNSIDQLGLKHAFVMLPQNIEINMSGLMAESNALVYPGFSGIVSADPPLAVIEAAVLGIPIVATNTGGISEVGAMIKNCSIVQVFDSKGMGNALIESLEKEGERHFISQTWNLFESKVAAQKFILIYRNLVAKNPSKSSKDI